MSSNMRRALSFRRTFPYVGFRSLHYPSCSSNLRLSWSKEVMSKIVPFTGDLIGTNQISFEGAAVRYHNESLQPGPVPPGVPRAVKDSWVEIILPFSDHIKLRNDMMLADNIRYGKLFEILDSLAADVAMRHTGARDPITGQYSMTIVTAAIDRMHIYKSINVTTDIVLRAYVGHVGTSSIEICIDILSTADEVLGEMMFIMVAKAPAGRCEAISVPKLTLDSDEDKARFLQGEFRAKARKQKRASSLSRNAPMPSEIEIIHSLYLQSVALKQQKDDIMKTALLKSGLNDTTNVSLPTAAKVTWMKETVFKNAYMMYPQDRNLHGNIFGGHILRRAFEAARVSASIFFGTEDKISFQAVDEINFVKPIPVGCIVEFTSTVTYSEMNVCVVNVRAATVDVTTGAKDTTNSFNYIFSVPMQYVDREHLAASSRIGGPNEEDRSTSCAVLEANNGVELLETNKADCIPSYTNCANEGHSPLLIKLPKVVPREYFEIVQYLEGRRSLRRHMLDAKEKAPSISSKQMGALF